MAEDVKSILTKSRRGTMDLFQGIEALRIKISVAKEDRSAIERLPVAKVDAEARVDAWLETIIKADLMQDLARRFVQPIYREPKAIDQASIVVAVIHDRVRDAVMKAVTDTYSNGHSGISRQDRDRALAEADERMLQMELAEEAIIRAAEAAGLDVLRRADANPTAVLAATEVLP